MVVAIAAISSPRSPAPCRSLRPSPPWLAPCATAGATVAPHTRPLDARRTRALSPAPLRRRPGTNRNSQAAGREEGTWVDEDEVRGKGAERAVTTPPEASSLEVVAILKSSTGLNSSPDLNSMPLLKSSLKASRMSVGGGRGRGFDSCGENQGKGEP